MPHTHDITHFSSRIELLQHQPKGGVVAEVGVHIGDFAQDILNIVKPDILYLIDYWPDENINNGPCVFNGLVCKEMVEERFKKEISAGVVRILHCLSTEASKHIAQLSLDWLYLDTSHWYPNTLYELRALKNLVKPYGFIYGHDYNYVAPGLGFCGVKRAVQEFTAETGLMLTVLTDVHPGRTNNSNLPAGERQWQSFGIRII